MRTWLPALLIGLATGYATLFVRETGWLIGALVLIVLPIVYLRQGRRSDVGWLFLGAGATPIALLGRTLWQTFTDPAIRVATDTWVFFFGAVLLAGVGISILVATNREGQAEP